MERETFKEKGRERHTWKERKGKNRGGEGERVCVFVTVCVCVFPHQE